VSVLLFLHFLHCFLNFSCLLFLPGDSSVSVSMPLPGSLVSTGLSSRPDRILPGFRPATLSPVPYGASSVVLPRLRPTSSAAGLLSVDSAFEAVVIPDVAYVLGPACSVVTGFPTPSGKFGCFPIVPNICILGATVKCAYTSSDLASQCFLYHLLMLNRRC
jgi:hypothetical protein